MRTLFQTLWLLVLTSLVSTAQAQIVSIPDPGLKGAILAALGDPVGPLTLQDLLSLTNLDASSRGVTSLEGLGAAANITTLSLSFNQLTNLTLPAGLTNRRKPLPADVYE